MWRIAWNNDFIERELEDLDMSAVNFHSRDNTVDCGKKGLGYYSEAMYPNPFLPQSTMVYDV